MSRPSRRAKPEPDPGVPAASTSGQRGEDLAARHLADRGYRIAARDLRTAHGEIDLLARRGRSWIAVEVKARRDHPAPERHVAPAQFDRLARALLALAPDLRPTPRSLQIDVIAIRWRDPAPPELLHFAAVRAWRRVASGPSRNEGWRPLAASEYSATADEVGRRRWRPSPFAAGRAVVAGFLRRLRRWREG